MTDDAIVGLSGGEQRFLRIVRSLAGGAPVNLNDDIPGLDRDIVQLVLAAIAHAAGERAQQIVGFERLGTLYPWPEA